MTRPSENRRGDPRQPSRIWGARCSERYRQTSRKYMRDYRRDPVRRQRENVLKRHWRRKHRRRARAARQAAEHTPRGRFSKLFRQRRYYDRCKEKGWRRVRVLDPCEVCGMPTRWRKWGFSGNVGVDLETMMARIVDLRWQWLAKCRACEKPKGELFIPRKVKLECFTPRLARTTP